MSKVDNITRDKIAERYSFYAIREGFVEWMIVKTMEDKSLTAEQAIEYLLK